MAYYEYNRNGNTSRSRGAGQKPLDIDITNLPPDPEQDELKKALKAQIGESDYWRWMYSLPLSIADNREKYIEALRKKIAENTNRPAA